MWLVMSASMGNCAPTTNGHHSEDSSDEAPASPGGPTGHPRWINPCGIDDSMAPSDIVDFTTQPYVPDLPAVLDTIIQQTNLALDNALDFRVEFLQHNFGRTDFDAYVRNFPNRFDWLPLPDKKLGEQTPEEHLKTSTVETALPEAYEMLQYYAVALEQVVYDLKDEEGIKNRFRGIENHLRSVLAEVQSAMTECGIRQKPDVQRDVMESEYRNYEHTTHRRIRDYMIYRDYMILLEYIKEQFTYLKDRL